MPRQIARRGVPPINDAEHGFPNGYLDGVLERQRANANVNTAVAHSTGMKKFLVFVAEMGWCEPYIPMDRPVTGLFRLLAYIDWLAYRCGFSKKTASQYYSNTKTYYLGMLPLLGYVDGGPWGPSGSHPMLISVALHNLPTLPHVGRAAIPREWIREGFDEWPRDVFVCLFMIHGWVGRKCEFLDSKTPHHKITWGMIEFLYIDKVTGQSRVMPRVDVQSVACDMVRIKPESRKAQERYKVREIPGRINFNHLVEVSKGLDSWMGGDVATVTQAHYVLSQAHRLTEDQLTVTPMLTFLGGRQYSSKELQVYLKNKAREHGVDPATVTLHGLRNGQVTQLVNGELQDNPVALLSVSGHASLQSQLPYQHLDVGMAKAVTNAFKY